jgi:hypothetical protein
MNRKLRLLLQRWVFCTCHRVGYYLMSLTISRAVFHAKQFTVFLRSPTHHLNLCQELRVQSSGTSSLFVSTQNTSALLCPPPASPLARSALSLALAFSSARTFLLAFSLFGSLLLGRGSPLTPNPSHVLPVPACHPVAPLPGVAGLFLGELMCDPFGVCRQQASAAHILWRPPPPASHTADAAHETPVAAAPALRRRAPLGPPTDSAPRVRRG